MNLVRALATNMAIGTAGKVVTTLIGLLTIAVLTRHLGPTEFGYYRTVLTFVSFACILADLGLYFVVLREISRPDADVPRVLGAALLLRLLGTGSVLFASACAALLLPYDGVVQRGMFLGALMYTAYQGTELLAAVFQMRLRQGRYVFAEIAGMLLALVAMLGLAWVGAGFIPMLAATVVGTLITFLLTWRFARGLQPFRLTLDLPLWRTFVAAGLPLAASHALGIAILRGDILVLSLLRPADEVGIYGVPAKMFEITAALPFMFAGFMLPVLTAAAAGRDRAAFARSLSDALAAVLMYGLAVILVFAFSGREVIRLIAGEAFVAGAPALAVLAFAMACNGISSVLRFALVSLERPRAVLLSDALGFVVAALAYPVLISLHSLLGAALARLLAECALLAGMTFGLRRAGYAVGLPPQTAPAAMAAAVAIATSILLRRLEVHWSVDLTVPCIVFLGLLVLLGAVPRTVLEAITRGGQARAT